MPIRKSKAGGFGRDSSQPKKIKLEITPAKVPFPALKYTLLPKYKDLKPGNAATNYFRALLHLKIRRQHNRDKRLEEDEEWYDNPLTPESLSTARKYIDTYGHVFDELDKAVLCEKCDWDMRLREATGIEQLTFHMEEIQQTRAIARLLRFKAHVEIVEKNYEQAIHTLQVGFRLASDVGSSESVISNLVGIAICYLIHEEALHLMGAKDAPNIYWAVAVIPRPLIDLKASLSLESTLPEKLIPVLKDPEKANLTPKQWSARLAKGLETVSRYYNGRPTKAANPYFLTTLVAAGYPRAKRKLLEWGFDAERVEKMPVAQVVLIHDKRILDYMYDEYLKWAALPHRTSVPGSKATSEKLKKTGFFSLEFQNGEVLAIGRLLMTAFEQIYDASSRSEIRIASIRVIEAIRIYAARNDGKLPNSLEDILTVPVPLHPQTGNPFPYRKIGNKSVLDVILTTQPGAESANYQFEITVRK